MAPCRRESGRGAFVGITRSSPRPVIASAARQSSIQTGGDLWIASSRSLLAMTSFKVFRGFRIVSLFMRNLVFGETGMNKEETLTLWAEGKNAWNAWAENMLDTRAAMEAQATWSNATDCDFEGHTFHGLANFRDVCFPGNVSFKGATFCRFADFGNVRFHGRVFFDAACFSEGGTFENVIFKEYLGFLGTKFEGSVCFACATFDGFVSFAHSKFNDLAIFDGKTLDSGKCQYKGRFANTASFKHVIFSGAATFCETMFSKEADFESATFAGHTEFNGTKFYNRAVFSSARSESAFSLAGTCFEQVPDFRQAHFLEAPNLDNVVVRPGNDDLTRASRYRALKRLAVQAHDHIRELEYFANEIKARRNHEDQWRHARWWVGWLYQFLSNFGRSMSRPVLVWGLLTILFASSYLLVSVAPAVDEGKAQAVKATTGSPAFISALFSSACLVGPGHQWSAALRLSICNGLPFPGVGSTEKLSQTYACLYGIHGDAQPAGELPVRFTPVIPDLAEYLSMVHTLLSLLLIFFFLFAVRNHFRIK